MKNLRTSINTGLRGGEPGGPAILRILLSQSGLKLLTQDGKFIALNG
jgi:hypothetical protein